MADGPDCSKLIAAGICHADCCGPIPFKRSFIENHGDKLQRRVRVWKPLLKLRKKGKPIDTGKIIPICEVPVCPFLTETYHCAIYDIRPNVCKKIGTKAHPCRYSKVSVVASREELLKAKEGE